MPSQPPVSLLRQAAARTLDRADGMIEPAVVAAMTVWLDAAKSAIIAAVREHGLTAAGEPDQPEQSPVDAAIVAYEAWRRELDDNVLPAIGIAFGDAFQQERLRDRTRGSFTPQQEYMATVADRLKIWPEGAFEELRPELIEALAEAESIEQITDRVAYILGIDKNARAIKADINAIDDRLKNDETLDATTRKALRARRRKLWEAHDADETTWRWKARRIARTEAHAAVCYGQLAAARQTAEETGDPYHKRWLATDDPRTRVSHRVADGQTVPLDKPFRVGGFLLQFPGDPHPEAPHESINCRCTLAFYHADALQDELQGTDGSLGEVRPEGVRIGPDDPDAVQEAIAQVARDEGRPINHDLDDRGEYHGQTDPGEPVDVPITDEREAPTVADSIDYAALDDDELLDLMRGAHTADDQATFDAALAEFDSRGDELQIVPAPEPTPDHGDDTDINVPDIAEDDVPDDAPDIDSDIPDVDDTDTADLVLWPVADFTQYEVDTVPDADPETDVPILAVDEAGEHAVVVAGRGVMAPEGETRRPVRVVTTRGDLSWAPATGGVLARFLAWLARMAGRVVDNRRQD